MLKITGRKEKNKKHHQHVDECQVDKDTGPQSRHDHGYRYKMRREYLNILRNI